MRSKKIISLMLSVLMLISIIPTIVFAAGSVTIQGPASLVSAPEGMYSSLSYVATFTSDSGTVVSSGEAPDSFSWEVKKGDAIATDVFFDGGRLIIAGGANGSYTLSATYNGIKGSLPLTISASTVANYGTVTTDTDRHPSSDIDQTKGSKTIEFSFSIPKAPGDSSNIIIERGSAYGGFSCVPVSGKNEQYYISYSKVGGTYLRYETSPYSEGNLLFDYGKTYNFKIVCADLSQPYHEIYLDNKKVGMYYSTGVVTSFSTVHTERKTLYSAASPDFSRFIEYSGVETEFTPPNAPKIEIDNQKTMLIPTGGKSVSTLYTASLENIAGNITWSLPENPTGVQIDEDTGVLTVSGSAAVGSVTVRASIGTVYGDSILTLKKIEDSISENTTWTAGSVKNENGNYYMDKASDLRYRVEAGMNGANDDFNLVIEQDIRPSASAASYNASLFMVGTNFSWFSIQTAGIDGTDWVNLKIVINPKDGRFFILANDVPTDMWIKEGGKDVRVSEMTISTTGGAYPAIVRDIGYTNCQVDNLKIYNVSNNPARVYSAAINSRISSKGTVSITNIVNINEDMNAAANEYKWYTCQSDGSAEEEITGKTASSLDLSKLELGECYIKAKVRANHQNVLDNTTIYGSEWTDTNICQVADFILGGPALTINGVLSDVNNIVIASDNTDVTLAISPLHTDGVVREILIVLAVYDKDSVQKELINIKALNCKSEEVWTADQSVTLEGLPKGSVVKAYVWEAKSLAPIEY